MTPQPWTNIQIERLALILASATKEVIHHYAIREIMQTTAYIPVDFGVSNRKTSHHIKKRGTHYIRYGKKAIRQKMESPRHAHGWTASSEIRERGYFSSEDNPNSFLCQLVALCLHEYAHLIQVYRGHPTRNNVHSPAFYRILDDLHRNHDLPQELSIYIYSEARDAGLPPLEYLRPNEEIQEFYPGQRVSFPYQGNTEHAIVIRVNKRTVSAHIEGNPKDKWRISPYILTPAPLENPSETQAPPNNGRSLSIVPLAPVLIKK